MKKKSWKNILLINIGAFLLVLLLEIMSGWLTRDQFESDLSFYLWELEYTVIIMTLIWINHFILIPFLLDKKRYFLFITLLIGSIFLVSYIKTYGKDWAIVSKIFFFFLYTTGTGMAAFFLRRNIIVQKENAEKEKLQKEMELNYLKEQVNPHFLFNSLNSIYALSRQQSLETPDVVMQLSELMRYQLESAKKDTVLLKEELDFVATISIKGIDAVGLMNKVTQIISNQMNVNIKSINIKSDDGIFDGIITLKVHNVSFLKELTKKLEKVEAISSITRTYKHQ